MGGLIDTALRLLAAFGLVVANAGFVAAEFAFVTVDRTKVDERVGQGNGRAVAVQRLLRRLSYHLSGAQLGITISSLLLGVLAGPAIATLLEPVFEWAFGATSRGASVAVALVIATVVQMVFGELVPKAIATSQPLGVSLALARPAAVYGLLARPVVALLDGMAARLTRRLGVKQAEDSTPGREEIEHIIRSSGKTGTLDEGEVELLTRSIRLAGKSADDAMIPRVRVEAIKASDTIAMLVALAAKTGYSRFPVSGADLDDVVGFVHVKAVHGIAIDRRADTLVTTVMSPVLAVPESRDLDELLVDLRQGGTQLAVVIDEHGGTEGIITLEDILEEIVGEIDDEYDAAPAPLTRIEAKGSTVLPASLHPDEVRDETGFEMPEGEYETLAGLVLDRLGHLPQPGEMVSIGGWRLEVVAMDRLRVATVRLVAPPEVMP